MFAKTHGVCGACPVNQTPFLLTTPINIAKYNTRIAKYNTKTNRVENVHKINGRAFVGRAGAGPVPFVHLSAWRGPGPCQNSVSESDTNRFSTASQRATDAY